MKKLKNIKICFFKKIINFYLNKEILIVKNAISKFEGRGKYIIMNTVQKEISI